MIKVPKRPRNPNQLAKLIVDIAAGGAEDGGFDVDTSAQKMGGKKGGTARASSMTPEERENIARLAAEARWKKN
jgi:hypothetical protein